MQDALHIVYSLFVLRFSGMTADDFTASLITTMTSLSQEASLDVCVGREPVIFTL